MFLNLQIPGFHAAVHQALHPDVRHRPVAVAADAGPHAPLFSASLQARIKHIHAGLPADVALRRCPSLVVVPPDPKAYRQAQHRLTDICATVTQRVAGSAGRIDLDLTPRQPDGSPATAFTAAATRAHIQAIALQLRQRCANELHLDAYIGGADHLLVARLIAYIAREHHMTASGVLVVARKDQATLIDLMPITLLAECDGHIRELLQRCGILTMGQLCGLSADHLVGLVGPGGADLYAMVHGLREETVPERREVEPRVSAACQVDDAGRGHDRMQTVLVTLARAIGVQLRTRQLACTRMRLMVTDRNDRTTSFALHLRSPSNADDDLVAATAPVMAKASTPDARIVRLRMYAMGLCPAEETQAQVATHHTPPHGTGEHHPQPDCDQLSAGSRTAPR